MGDNVVGVVHQGQGFGEMGIMKNDSIRQATIVCETDCSLATLNRDDYKLYLLRNQIL